MIVLGIDPGTDESAWVLYDDDDTRVLNHAIGPNGGVLAMLGDCMVVGCHDVVIEHMACYGMPVGAEVLETCVWIGRFWEAAGPSVNIHLLYRRDVKLHLCGQARAKDANVRQALIDRFGGRQAAVGTKKQPGPLFGIRADEWSALALAITFLETV